MIAELRNDISKLRERIASTSEPNRDDVLKMEVCTILICSLLKVVLIYEESEIHVSLERISVQF